MTMIQIMLHLLFRSFALSFAFLQYANLDRLYSTSSEARTRVDTWELELTGSSQRSKIFKTSIPVSWHIVATFSHFQPFPTNNQCLSFLRTPVTGQVSGQPRFVAPVLSSDNL